MMLVFLVVPKINTKIRQIDEGIIHRIFFISPLLLTDPKWLDYLM